MKKVSKKTIALAAILLLLVGIFAATAFAGGSAEPEPPTLVAVASMQVADFRAMTGQSVVQPEATVGTWSGSGVVLAGIAAALAAGAFAVIVLKAFRRGHADTPSNEARSG